MSHIDETSVCRHTPVPASEAKYQFELLMDQKPTVTELWCSKKMCASCGHEIIISYKFIIYYLLFVFLLPSFTLSPSLIVGDFIVEDMTLWKGWLWISIFLLTFCCVPVVFYNRIPYWLYARLPWMPADQAILSVGRHRFNIRKKLYCNLLEWIAFLLGALPVLGVIRLL